MCVCVLWLKNDIVSIIRTGFNTYKFQFSVTVCEMYAGACMCHNAHVQDRGQLVELAFSFHLYAGSSDRTCRKSFTH